MTPADTQGIAQFLTDRWTAAPTAQLDSPYAGVIDLSDEPDTATVTCVFPQCAGVSCDADEPTEVLAAYLEDHRVRVHGQPARPGHHVPPVRDLRPLFGPGYQIVEGRRAA